MDKTRLDKELGLTGEKRSFRRSHLGVFAVRIHAAGSADEQVVSRPLVHGEARSFPG